MESPLYSIDFICQICPHHTIYLKGSYFEKRNPNNGLSCTTATLLTDLAITFCGIFLARPFMNKEQGINSKTRHGSLVDNRHSHQTLVIPPWILKRWGLLLLILDTTTSSYMHSGFSPNWPLGNKKKCYEPLWQRQQKKNIGATIHIGREIWCLPYGGFQKLFKYFPIAIVRVFGQKTCQSSVMFHLAVTRQKQSSVEEGVHNGDRDPDRLAGPQAMAA